MKVAWRFLDKHRYLLLTTGIVLMLGLIFSRTFGMEEEQQQQPVIGNVQRSEGKLYLVSLGTWESFEEVLAVEGALRVLELPVGMTPEGEGYHLFTSIVSDPAEASGILSQLEGQNIQSTLQTVEPDFDASPAWSYFYDAVNQRRFAIDEASMDLFSQDEMEIWGFLGQLSGGGRELASAGRQQMLLEIFEWLTLKQGDIIGNNED